MYTLLVGMAMAFQSGLQTTRRPTQLAAQKQRNPMESFLRQITNNFQPFHGHGSLEDDLDEQWEAQQEILRNRQSHHIDKTHLKEKYSNPESVTFDVGTVGDKPTYENKNQGGFTAGEPKKKNFWDNFTP